MPSFVVCRGSITTGKPECPLLRPGAVVPDGVLTDAQVEGLLSEGVLRMQLTPAEEALKAKHEAFERAEAEKTKVVKLGDVKDDNEPAPGERIPAPKGRWDLNPTLLLGKSLDDLNVMVLERDADAPVFETVEEAVAQLSQDFRG